MRIAHFDPVTGASGDMILAALLDAGLPLDELRAGLASLPVPAFRLDTEEVTSGSLRARRLILEIPDQATHRHLPQVLAILRGGKLPAGVVANAERVFVRLAEAEARSHGIPLEKVHFHEVGALDAILDIAGACLGLHLLGVEEVRFSALRVGTGEVNTAHGKIPVPVPAVVELTRGLPIVRTDIAGEILTPTGAAILTTLGRPAEAGEAMVAEAVGVGAGTKELPGRPNVLRVTLGQTAAVGGAGEGGAMGAAGAGAAAGVGDGEAAAIGVAASVFAGAPWNADEIEILETNLDDMSPEALPTVLERAMAAGAVDAFVTPILMKKGRPGQLLTVLAPPEKAVDVARVLFRETTTFGIRRRRSPRWTLARESCEIVSPWGPVRVKLGRLGDGTVRVAPEYESLREIADRTGTPLLEVYGRVEQLIRNTEWMGSAE